MFKTIFLSFSLLLLIAEVVAGEEVKPLYSEQEIADFCKRFNVYRNEFYFPPQSFLEAGYAPPGGYVKDFSVIKHDGRYHLFHIDGRPEERCGESGNEISFGHASTADLRHWIRHRMPLAVGDQPWENEHIWAPFVTKWKDKFYMFYMACGRNTPGVLTYAASDDLETWTKWLGGAIKTAQGRDPFVRYGDDGTIYLYFSFNYGGLQVVTSRDMQTWSEAKYILQNPRRAPAESCSVHRRDNRWVLWYNDYIHCADPTGDFRPVYIFSDDPEKFDPENLKVFNFTTTLPTQYGEKDWLEKRPIPVSIELLEKGENAWLVTYFRWHIDRFRLFIGVLRWDADPASIEEITTPERLAEVLKEIKSL
ncbi:MAG: family 43 glycosylhydrolase [Sedimentisphaerales bacterium]|nr:family 43 glycosylhydrolase [Sedimentisphaerales bacterium]